MQSSQHSKSLGKPRPPHARHFVKLALAALVISLAMQPAIAQHYVDVTNAVGLGSYMASAGDGHGPGAVFTDLDNDSFPDLYVVRAGNANELYRNVPGVQPGTRVFVREPNDGDAGNRGAATGAIAADYDNDGDTDLFVINFNQPNVLFQNQLAQGQGLTFVDVTSAAGLGPVSFQGVALDNTLTAAWGDVDRDGHIDLYVGNHDGWCGSPMERAVPGQRDIFYRNNGNGTFSEETLLWGLEGFEDASGQGQLPDQWYSSTNAVIFADFNNDRWPDLLVTNKVGTKGGACPADLDMLYLNNGLDSAGNWAGYSVATHSLPSAFGDKSNAAMGVDVGDPDNDGDLDIYISDHLSQDTPTLPGKADFWVNLLSDTGTLDFAHSDTLMPAAWGWGVDWFDMDNDGHQDVHTSSQLIANQPYWQDFFYSVRPNGTVLEVSNFLGVDQIRQARGNPHADYDKDGWVDFFVVNSDNANGPSVLFENRLDELLDHHWLVLELVGKPNLTGRTKSSRDAIGARVEISADLDGDGVVEPGETQYREVVSGHGNAATTSSLAIEVGLRFATSATVRVLWPSGRVSTHALAADQCIGLEEPNVDGVEIGDPMPVP